VDETALKAHKIELAEVKRLSKLFKKSKTPGAISSAVGTVHQNIDDYFRSNLDNYKIQLACKEGCNYCCYLRVEVFIPEVFRIKYYLEKNLSSEALSEIKLAISATAKRARGLSTKEYSIAQIPCPLLINNRCSIYSVRPGMCRKYHSLDVELCIKNYNEPDNDVYGAVSVRGLSLGIMSFLKGLHFSLKKQKLDDNTYELSQALEVTLDTPKAYAQWRQGKVIFAPLPE